MAQVQYNTRAPAARRKVRIVLILRDAKNDGNRGPQPIPQSFRQSQPFCLYGANGVELVAAVLVADPLEELVLIVGIRRWRRSNVLDEDRHTSWVGFPQAGLESLKDFVRGGSGTLEGKQQKDVFRGRRSSC